MTNLLHGLLKRNAADRLDFEVFFNHPFLRQTAMKSAAGAAARGEPTTTRGAAAAGATGSAAKQARPTSGVPAPSRTTPVSTPRNTPGRQSPVPGMLPPSPVAAAMASSPRYPQQAFDPSPVVQRRIRTAAAGHQQPGGSSPDAAETEDFVMVPEHLTMDAAEVRRHRPAGAQRRHTVSGATARPASLPVNLAPPQTDPIPVPSQKANYQQLQQSIIRSRSKSGDSVSAMSGISSASGGSTLGPLPEEGVAPSPSVARRPRASSMSSPTASPKSPHQAKASASASAKARRISAPPIPDICQLSPPTVQYTAGGATPPVGAAGFAHRRRTSSSSSCGTPPPTAYTPSASPVRRTGSGASAPGASAASHQLFPNVPCLSPILGSPNKPSSAVGAVGGGEPNTTTALMQYWDDGNRASTLPEHLSDPQQQQIGRNVVLNYGYPAADHPRQQFERSSSLNSLQSARRHSSASLTGGKENSAPIFPMELAVPPPELSEETLLAPEHNEILAKLKFVCTLVDTILDVARCKTAGPLSVLADDVRNQASPADAESSPMNKRLQQLLLYMRCLHLLSQTLDFSRAELKSKRLKPSTSVKTGTFPFDIRRLPTTHINIPCL